MSESKNLISSIKSNKTKVSEFIEPMLNKIDIKNNKGRQSQQELIDIGKFILASKLDIQLLTADFEIPDFLIKWDGILYGLEHTEVIDQKKKESFEKTEWLMKETEKFFLDRYGNIGKQISFSLKFEVTLITKKEKKKLLKHLKYDFQNFNLSDVKLMRLAYPGYLTKEDMSLLAVELADKAYSSFINKQEIKDEDDIINSITFYNCSKTYCTRIASWSAGNITDSLIAALNDKEEKIETYIKNTKGLKQCLFLLINGSNGYSDYASFDCNALSKRSTPFDKVVAFNFFTNEYYIIK